MIDMLTFVTGGGGGGVFIIQFFFMHQIKTAFLVFNAWIKPCLCVPRLYSSFTGLLCLSVKCVTGLEEDHRCAPPEESQLEAISFYAC